MLEFLRVSWKFIGALIGGLAAIAGAIQFFEYSVGWMNGLRIGTLWSQVSSQLPATAVVEQNDPMPLPTTRTHVAKPPQSELRPRSRPKDVVPPLPGSQTKDELAALSNPGSVRTGVGRVVAVEVVAPGGFGAAAAASAFSSALASSAGDSVQVSSAFFSDQFRTAGHLERVLKGDASILVRMGAFAKVDAVVVGRLTWSCEPGSAHADMTVCDVALDYRVFSAGGLSDSGRLMERGSGFSKDDAVVRGAELIAERDARRILRSAATG